MDNEIITLIKSNRENGISWDDIQKNISTRYGEEYSISEIRKAFNSPIPILQAKSNDEFQEYEELSLTFNHEPSDQKSGIDGIFSNIDPELVKIRDENDKLKIKLNELSLKWKNEIEKRVNAAIKEKDKIINGKNEEIDELNEEVDRWQNRYQRGSNVVNEIERDGYLKQIKEKDIIINRLTRFKKITYYMITAGVVIIMLKIGWNYYFR